MLIGVQVGQVEFYQIFKFLQFRAETNRLDCDDFVNLCFFSTFFFFLSVLKRQLVCSTWAGLLTVLFSGHSSTVIERCESVVNTDKCKSVQKINLTVSPIWLHQDCD